jgi:hypothetical protein
MVVARHPSGAWRSGKRKTGITFKFQRPITVTKARGRALGVTATIFNLLPLWEAIN